MSFLVLLLGVAFIIVSITLFKVHPFIALILAAILVGILSPVPLTAGQENRAAVQAAQAELQARLDRGEISQEEFTTLSAELPWKVQEDYLRRQRRPGGQTVLAVELTAVEFGATAGAIGIVIALAAIIGQCLMESGAADKITRRSLAVLGEKRAPLALLASGYILSVPVFFDTVFFLLIPLARALRVRTGMNYVHYVMAIAAGGVVTHSLVPPTPGPLIMVENLPGLSLGMAIGVGFLLGLGPALVAGLVYAGWVNKRMPIPFREISGSSLAELESIVRRDESQLPGFLISIAPVVLPVLLITSDTVLQSMQSSGAGFPPLLLQTVAFFGNKNIALLIATFLAVYTLKRQSGLSLSELRERMEPALLSAGVIILITAAGGAFGRMLARTGISDSLQQTMGGMEGMGTVYLILAFGLAATMKIAQGSGTVSMITASAMMAAVIGSGDSLPYHIIYIYAAIGFGSLIVSWMNDSGFWVVCKMSGFTERETLTTWTILLIVVGVLGFIETLVLSWVLPLR